MVLNVEAKGSVKRSQVRVKKLNESKPYDEVAKQVLVGKTIDLRLLIGRL
jgi:hypothetical protein